MADKSQYVVYVLQDRYGRLYIGSSGNFKRRLHEHVSGQNKSTRGRDPFKVLLIEKDYTRHEALRREKILKSGQGREWLKQFKGV